MKCPTEAQLNEHAAGRLDTRQRWEISAHLEGCPDCRRQVAELRQATDWLGLLPAPAGDHPDDDALAALTEGSLPGPERAQVLAHLGQCPECATVLGSLRREVAPAESRVAAAAAVAAPPAAPPARRRLPVWASFAAAAALLIVVGGVSLLNSRGKMAALPGPMVASAPAEPAPQPTAAAARVAKGPAASASAPSVAGNAAGASLAVGGPAPAARASAPGRPLPPSTSAHPTPPAGPPVVLALKPPPSPAASPPVPLNGRLVAELPAAATANAIRAETDTLTAKGNLVRAAASAATTSGLEGGAATRTGMMDTAAAPAARAMAAGPAMVPGGMPGMGGGAGGGPAPRRTPGDPTRPGPAPGASPVAEQSTTVAAAAMPEATRGPEVPREKPLTAVTGRGAGSGGAAMKAVPGVADQVAATPPAASSAAMARAAAPGQKTTIEPSSVRNKKKPARHKRRPRAG
jgi:anti-sigma factor RsiW